MGRRLLKQKRYEQGLAILLPLQLRIELRDETKLEIARALHSTRRAEEMIRLFAAAKAPPMPEVNYLLGSSYKEVALEKLTHMVQLAPESARAHQVLGDAYFAEQRFDDAAGQHEAAVPNPARNPNLQFPLVRAHVQPAQILLCL